MIRGQIPVEVERRMIDEIVRGFTCQMPLCCILDYTMFHVGLKSVPIDMDSRATSIVGHTGFSIVFPESVHGIWLIQEVHDGSIQTIKPKDNDFIVFRFTSDEYRPCRACRARMIGDDMVLEWWFKHRDDDFCDTCASEENRNQ